MDRSPRDDDAVTEMREALLKHLSVDPNDHETQDEVQAVAELHGALVARGWVTGISYPSEPDWHVKSILTEAQVDDFLDQELQTDTSLTLSDLIQEPPAVTIGLVGDPNSYDPSHSAKFPLETIDDYVLDQLENYRTGGPRPTINEAELTQPPPST